MNSASRPLDTSEELRAVVDSNLRVKARLLRMGSRWQELCSAMDVVRDTDLALESYLLHSDTSRATAEDALARNYLRVYGALQCLVVQQDAVRAIASIVGSRQARAEENRRLQEIRRHRNLAVGHPTRAALHPGKPSSFIVQVSLGEWGFDVLSLHEDGSQNTSRVSLVQLIPEQRRILATALAEARKQLVRDDARHKRTFKNVKLVKLFNSVNYNLGKTYDLVHCNEDARHMKEMASLYLPEIGQAFDGVEAELRRRGDFDTYEGTLEPDLALVRHCMARITELLKRGLPREESRMDAMAYYTAIRHIADSMHSLLETIDAEYAAEE